MKTKLFKRILSMALALVFMLALAAPLAVSADEVDLGVVKIFSGIQASAPGSDFKLQEDGLLLKAAHSRPVGFMLTPANYDITALNENYTISVTMTSAHYNGNDEATETVAPNTSNYSWMVFGTGSNTFQAKNEADEWRICSNMVTENGDATKDPGVRVCYDSASQKYSLAFDGQTVANTAEIAEAILTKSGAVRYDFAFDATAKTMTSVTFTLVSDSNKTATYDFADVAVGEGNFGFALREVYASVKSRFTGVVSELSVKTATETKYSVDFRQKYIDNGGTVTPGTPDTPKEPIVINPVLFDANRTVPKASATLGFEDTPLTEYVDGAVLHHVDFTKVTDLASVGYFVTKPLEGADSDAKYAYTSEGLYLEGSSQKVYLVPTGIVIPEYNRNFTVEIEFRFVEANNMRYLCLCPNTTFDEATGTATHSGDVCIRYNQTNESSNGFDSAKRKGDYTAEQGAAINDARDNFEFVTYQFHFVNRKLDSATITSGDKKLEVTPQSALLATEFSFMLGTSSGGPNVKVLIDHVTVISGDAAAANGTLVWPEGKTGENVLVVPASVVKADKDDNNDNNNNNNNNDNNEDTGAANTESTDTKAPETNIPDTSDTAKAEEKSGCGGSIGFAAACVVALCAGAVATAKRKKKD